VKRFKSAQLIGATVIAWAFALPAVAQQNETPSGDAGRPSNVPAAAEQMESDVAAGVRRFGIGVEAGIGLDPELVLFGAHGTFAPVFSRHVAFRPGIQFGVGEVTTTFGVNLDVLYYLPGLPRAAAWSPYIGAGPNFGLSHRGFEAETGTGINRNRFDFGDTSFEGGMNFITGVRRRNGTFFEMKATAYGVSNVGLLVGFNF
jgi:hypothetical protein